MLVDYPVQQNSMDPDSKSATFSSDVPMEYRWYCAPDLRCLRKLLARIHSRCSPIAYVRDGHHGQLEASLCAR